MIGGLGIKIIGRFIVLMSLMWLSACQVEDSTNNLPTQYQNIDQHPDIRFISQYRAWSAACDMPRKFCWAYAAKDDRRNGTITTDIFAYTDNQDGNRGFTIRYVGTESETNWVTMEAPGGIRFDFSTDNQQCNHVNCLLQVKLSEDQWKSVVSSGEMRIMFVNKSGYLVSYQYDFNGYSRAWSAAMQAQMDWFRS